MFAVTKLAAMADELRALPAAADDAECVDRIRLLEELRSVVAAVQAEQTAAFAASQRDAQRAAGLPAERVGRGVASQVGLARRLSPYQAQRYTGWVAILTSELPATFAALRAGRVSEWRAMIVARETAWLSREDRSAVDAELAPRLEHLGDRRVEAEAKRLGYSLDPQGYVARIRNAAADRRVGIRPAPDVMGRLTALMPVAQAVATYAALVKHADALIATGDPRGRGQIMADTLFERTTGIAVAGDVPVEINLVMTGETLFGGDAEPAQLDGYGPIPAAVARGLVFGPGDETPMWIRRLFTSPATGQLAAMDSRRRAFTANQRHFLRLRDQQCRQPYCDAPIRHIDHVLPVHSGGRSTVWNGQGFCASCNYAKQAPGWRSQPGPGGLVTTVTPTGHHYRSRAPDPPGARHPRRKPRQVSTAPNCPRQVTNPPEPAPLATDSAAPPMTTRQVRGVIWCGPQYEPSGSSRYSARSDIAATS